MRLRFLIFYLFPLIITLFQPAYAQENLVFSAIEGGSRSSTVCEEILQVALKRLGINLQLRELPGTRALMMSNRGDTDGELVRIRGIEKKFPNLIRIEVACVEAPIYLFVKSGKEFPVSGWESVPPNYTLSSRRGVKFMEGITKKYGIEVLFFDDMEHRVLLLNKGRVDAVVGTPEHLGKLITKLGYKDIVMLEPPVLKHNLYTYLHKKHGQLAPKLTSVLKKMEASGEIQSIRNRAIAEIQK